MSHCTTVTLTILSLFACSSNAQLSPTFYDKTCPNLQTIVHNAMKQALNKEPRLGASILRLFFHDCFVNGCDASILLDDTATFVGEKNAGANKNSARGFEVIDTIKTNVEANPAYNGKVSCADILALAARDGIALLGGPSWAVPLGRTDARTTNIDTTNNDIPQPSSDLTTLTTKFAAKGLSPSDLTVLSGAHTIGQSECQFFKTRIYNETNIDTKFATSRQANCPFSFGGETNLASLDSLTPNRFDNNYYKDLVVNRGLLHSDQVLFNGESQDSLVRTYSTNNVAFFNDFVAAMVKMSKISPLTGTSGESRKNCRVIN
ncbi:PREDICTED: peroxidase P7-like [Lupinus angustifolius]|uniref:peroxidase P7-like n=1 Tax=Lupinus angustifolius TaxID=3871 RepID=UPI00092E66ED|nr:PREDICTED: peroxidase P7-like [Lupinus angustifolius]